MFEACIKILTKFKLYITKFTKNNIFKLQQKKNYIQNLNSIPNFFLTQQVM